MTNPNTALENVRGLIVKAIQQQIDEVIEEEITIAQRRIGERIRISAAQIAVNLAEKFNLTFNHHVLSITVDFRDIKQP